MATSAKMPPGAIRLATWQHQIGSQKVAECVRLANENELDTKICTKRLLEELEKPTDIYRPSKILEERERESAMSNQYQSRTRNSREAKKKSKKHWPRNLLFDASQTHGQIWFPWNRVSMRKSGTWSFAMPFGLGVRSFAGQMMPHFKWVGWTKALHFSTFLLDSSNKKWAKLWGQEFECSSGCGMQLVASSAHLLRLCWHAFFSSLWHVVRQEERGNLEQREQSVWLRNVSASLNPLCEHDMLDSKISKRIRMTPCYLFLMPPMPPALTSYWHSVQTCSNAQRVIEDQDPWDRRHKGHWLLARSQRPMHSWQDLETFQDISSTFEYMAYHNVHRLGLPSQKHCMPSGVAQKAGHFEQLPSAYSIDLTHPSPRLSTWKKCPQFGSSVRRLPSCSDTTSVEWRFHGKIYQNLLVLLQANRATALLSQMKTCQDRFTQKDKKSQTEMRRRQLWHTNWRSSTALICSNMFFACFLHVFYIFFITCSNAPPVHPGAQIAPWARPRCWPHDVARCIRLDSTAPRHSASDRANAISTARTVRKASTISTQCEHRPRNGPAMAHMRTRQGSHQAVSWRKHTVPSQIAKF